MVSCQIPDLTAARLDEVSRARRQSRSALMREAINRLVDEEAAAATRPVRVRRRKPDLADEAA